MEKFERLTAVAAPLGIPNVDTDAIIPKQFLKTIKRAGLGKALFSERRYNDNGEERPLPYALEGQSKPDERNQPRNAHGR